jgi:hypothetical protein
VSFNGAGTFVINSTGNPVVTGTTISSTWANALTADLATGLSTCILRDGTQTLTANIPFGGFKITGLGNGSASTDSITYGQVGQLVGGSSYTTTATAAGTTTLTVSSTYGQFFTGTTTQTVVLPDVTTLFLGFRFDIINNSTGIVTVNSSGSNLVVAMPAASRATVTCILLTGTTAASWDVKYTGITTITGTGAMVRATSPTMVTPTLGAASATSINFGGTSLSVYAEGTFVPGIAFGGGTTGITYAAQTGAYTRIGNRVMFELDVELSNKGSSAGSATVTGLPFTAANSDVNSAPNSVRANTVNLDTAGAYYQVQALNVANATTLSLVETGDNVAAAALDNTDFSNTSTLRIRGHYFV